MVVLAVQWNGDILSNLNIIGLIVCLFGISSHIIHKIKTMPSRSTKRVYSTGHERHELAEYLIDNASMTHYNSYSSESDGHSDTEELFNILNRHES